MNIIGIASRRHLLRHPWQLALAVLGIALGVAVVVSVDLASDSVHRAFELSVKAVAGDATHQITGGAGDLDETLYTRLRVDSGMRESAPVIEAWISSRDTALHLVGIDPLAEMSFGERFSASEGTDVTRLLTEPGTVLMSAATARRLGLVAGERFRISLGGHDHELRLLGLLGSHPSGPAAIDGLLITDIATVQAISSRPGQLDRIDLILGDTRAGRAMLADIQRMLPAGVRVEAAGSRSDALLQMTRAFHTNLTAMSLLTLIVGMFLIYNTMTFVVLQRRTLIASLRILGVTRRQVFGLVFSEALAVGLAGSTVGLLLGLVLAQGLVHLVTRTINDLYFVLSVSQLLISPLPLLKGPVLGLGATLLAALLPAAEAARTAPAAALQRSGIEARAHMLAPGLALGGLTLTAAALLLLFWPGRSLLAGYVQLFMLVLGLTLISPLMVYWLARASAPLWGWLLGIQARLAVNGVAASLSRTGVAIAALMLAVATTVGVSVMVESFRASVEHWLSATLRADVYVSAPAVQSGQPGVALAPAVLERLARIPGIDALSTGRRITVAAGDQWVSVFALGLERSLQPRYPLKAGDPERVWPAFLAGEGVLISEPLAWHRRLDTGEHISLHTDYGDRTFRVLGIYYDYGSQAGEVLMHRPLYELHFEDRSVSAAGLYLAAGADLQQAIETVRQVTAGIQRLNVVSNRDLREASLAIFDRTFTITGVLRLLVIVVAFVGILSAFMALQLERARELGVLRATGFTPAQVAGMVTTQTGFMGLASGLLAIPTGLALAALLIEVINRRSFGWSMTTVVSSDVMLEALLLATVAALLAGLYPGWRMAHASPAEALRSE